MPTLELNEDFEGGSLAAYSSPGAAAIDSTAALEGSLGLHTAGAGAQNIGYSPPAGQTLCVGRFTFKVPVGGTPTGATAVLYQVHTVSSKNLQIRLTAAGILQAFITAGSAVSFGTITEGQEYTIDFRADCSGATYTIDWQVDGVAQTQATSAQAASTISTSSGEKLGNVTSGVTAFTCYFDSWAISRDTADYPIGAPSTPLQTIDAGTITNAATLHAPTFAPAGHVTILPDSIATAVAVHAATLAAAGSADISLDQLASGASIHGPTVAALAAHLAVSQIASTAAPHAPTITGTGHATITVARTAGTATPHKPTVAPTGAVQIDAGTLNNGAALHGPVVDPGVVAFSVPSIAATSSATAPTSAALVANSYEVDEDFDGGFTAWAVTGSPVLDEATPIHGLASARFSGTGFQWLKHPAPAGHTVEVFRFLYRHDSVPTGAAANLYTCDSSSGKNATIRVTPSGVIQACVTGGGLNANGPTLVLGTTYRIDGRFDVSTSTFTIDWQVDGVDETQATYAAGAAGTISQSRPGQAAPASTFDYTLDSVAISRNSSDYPIGAPAAAALQLRPALIASAATLPGPVIDNAGNLVIRAPRIAATGHPDKPSIALQLPTPPANAYSGARGVMVRTTSEDITSTYNTRPWADLVRCWKTWSALELSHGAFTWGGVITSLQYCIDNGRKMWLTIQMGQETPAWAYAANPTGALEQLRVYTGPTDTTGYTIPLPWDANLPLHYQRIIDALATLLATTYNGKTYGDVVDSITFGYSVTGEVGHEMSIGDNGDARNTSMWNAYGTVLERQQFITDAWIDALDRFFATLPDHRPNIGCGTVWSDARKCSKDVALYAATTYPDKAAQVLMGPTDMRVDKPGAVSYRAWSASAADALLYYAQVGVTPWCQSAGDSWFGSGSFDIPTADAVKKSYLDNGCDIYRCVIVESNTQILQKYALDSWAQGTLAPAIKALALPQTIRAGHIASTAAEYAARATIPQPPYVFERRIESTAQLRGALIQTLGLPSPDFIVPCYNESVLVSSPETLIVSDVGAFVYEVEL